MTKNFVLLAAAVLGTSIAATPAMAGHIRVENLAERIVDDLEDLGKEFRDDYRYTPEYPTLLASTLEMHRLACQLERLADCKGSLAEIDALTCSLERLLPRLQSTVARVHCHNLHGATRGVARNLKDIVDDLCEVREEVNEMKRKWLSKRAPVIHHNVIHRQEVIRHDVGRHDVGNRNFGGHDHPGNRNFGGHDHPGNRNLGGNDRGHNHPGNHTPVQFGVRLGQGGPTLGFGNSGFSIRFGR